MNILRILWTWCSTYGQFAQPMDIFLGLWAFYSTYGHLAHPMVIFLSLWRSSSAYGHFAQPMDILLHLSTLCLTFGQCAGRIDGREHRTPQVGALWPPAGPPRTPSQGDRDARPGALGIDDQRCPPPASRRAVWEARGESMTGSTGPHRWAPFGRRRGPPGRPRKAIGAHAKVWWKVQGKV